MDKAVLVIDMPSCCDECFALDDNGDYPFCLITQEQRGYTFRTKEQKMDKCPLKPVPEKRHQPQYQGNGVFGYRTAMRHEYARGWNECIDYFSSNNMKEKDINLNQMAEDAINNMHGLSLKDMEKLIFELPGEVAKLVLIKIIRRSQ